jgi:hypothetical protein
LYFCSVLDVRLDANAMGSSRSTHFPDGLCMHVRWDSTAARPSWHPSDVMTNGEPLYLGAWRIGHDTNAAFRSRNAFVCSCIHRLLSLKSHKVRRYVFLVYGCVNGASFTRLHSGPSRLAYPSMRSLK